MPLEILLVGARGRMGQAIAAIAADYDGHIRAACDVGDDPAPHCETCQVIIDFSSHQATAEVAQLAAQRNLPLVIGTTGHSPAEKQQILDILADSVPAVWAGNYSVGVNTLNYLTRKAATILGPQFEPELMEMHHHDKKDAPSGTAARLIEILQEAYQIGNDQVVHGRSGIVGARPRQEIGVHALRGGDIVGEHTVYFCGQGERIELTHRATDRKIFAQGALRAAHWAVGQKPGVYNMEDVLGLTEY